MNFNITPMVKNLLIINVGIYFIGAVLHADLDNIFGLRYILSTEFQPYQIFTHMFMHANIGHLLSNMFALFMFGPLLENAWGGKKFLIFYIVCGLGAAMLYSGVTFYEVHGLQTAMENYLMNPTPDAFVSFVKEHAAQLYDQFLPMINDYSHKPDSPEYISETKDFVKQLYEARANMPMVGASGAIFGILMGFGMLFPNTVLMLMFPPIPLKAKYFVAIYGLVELFTGVHRIPGDNIAHFAHIGGMLFAFLLIKIWKNDRNDFY